MDPLEVAAVLAALSAPEARLITGSMIAIDQGMSAGRAASGFVHGGMSMLYG